MDVKRRTKELVSFGELSLIPYGRQAIDSEDIDAVVTVLKSPYLTQGPEVSKFEKSFAEYVGAQYAVAVCNGTAALHLSALAVGIKQGDVVITTSITFAASANCIRYCGAEVVFCDIDPDTYTISVPALRTLLEDSPNGTYAAILPVDFAGYPCDMQSIKELAQEYNLKVIEDACHAPGGYVVDGKGEKQYCGNGIFADATVFSFHPVKHIACGEGGMVTTNDKDIYEKVLQLRSHGVTKNPDLLQENHGGWYYEMQELGYNYRLTDLQAALGTSQLKKAEAGVVRRNEIALRYDDVFLDSAVATPFRGDDVFHAFHLYVIQVKDRLGLYNHLKEHEIFSQVHYVPVHTMPYYKNIKEYSLPFAESYYENCLSLPMFPSLSNEEVDKVIQHVLEYVS